MSITLHAVWTEEAGISLSIEHGSHGATIIVNDMDTPHDEPPKEIARYTLALDNRRSLVGEAILPDKDKEALEMGRHLQSIIHIAKIEKC